MNIQSLGSTSSIKLDDRPVGATDGSAPAASAAPAKPVGSIADAAAAGNPSRKQVDDAVKKLNDSMPSSAQSLQFSVDHDSKEIVVKLIDQDTKEVLRQIPTPEALQMAKQIDASMDKKQGMLIRQTA